MPRPDPVMSAIWLFRSIGIPRIEGRRRRGKPW
jgi:hypothetical protein